MARKYSSDDAEFFGPEETTAIPEDVEESQRKELVEKYEVRESADQERLFQGDGKDKRIATKI